MTKRRILSLSVSHLLDFELRALNAVADELREVFVERGHRIEQAMETDPAFGSGWSHAALSRDLAVGAASGAASRIGLDFRPVNGGGREFRTLAGTIDRRFRLRRAHRRADGTTIITANSDSALAVEDGSFFDQEQWVLSWMPTPEGAIEVVFVAEVVGFVEGRPGHLTLGPMTLLGGEDLPAGGFNPTDEDLDGFGEDEGWEEESGSSA